MKLKNVLKNMEKNNDFFNLISEYIYIFKLNTLIYKLLLIFLAIISNIFMSLIVS